MATFNYKPECNFPHHDETPVYHGDHRLTNDKDMKFLKKEIREIMSDIMAEGGDKVAIFNKYGDLKLNSHMFAGLYNAMKTTTKEILAFEPERLKVDYKEQDYADDECVHDHCRYR